MLIDRTDKSLVARWCLGVDKTILIETIFLILIGTFMIFSATPYSADRSNLDEFIFIKKYLIYVIIGLFTLIVSSFISIKNIKRLSVLGFVILCICLIATLFSEPIKGATRWINILGTSVQPSEYLKPIFAVVVAIILVRIKEFQSLNDKKRMKNNLFLLFGILAFVIGSLILQPDMGMTITFLVIFVVEVFVAGIAWKWILTIGVIGVGGLFSAYSFMPHFYNRINTFLFGGDTYQIDMGLEAIRESGIFFGHSNNLKKTIPDVHTDFIFTAMVEEFGVLLSIIVLTVFFYLIIRVFNLLKDKKNPFVIFVGTGIAAYLIFQVCVNVASALGMIPTKGMTLPFISYGGSSFISSCLGVGILLSILQGYNMRGDRDEKK